jgi:hypothetical protein
VVRVLVVVRVGPAPDLDLVQHRAPRQAPDRVHVGRARVLAVLVVQAQRQVRVRVRVVRARDLVLGQDLVLAQVVRPLQVPRRPP